MTHPSRNTVQAWARLTRAQTAARSHIEDVLKKKDLPLLTWYDVLLELDRAGKDGLRPFELEQALLLPQYGISRLIERIETAGHLQRLSCDEDGRGQTLVTTASGETLRKRMWEVYGPAIQECIGSKLTPSQIKSLSQTLAKLMD